MKKHMKPYQLVIAAFFTLLVVVCLVPLWSILVASFTEEKAIAMYGYQLWPKVFSTSAYEYLFMMPGLIFGAYKVSGIVTLAGTSASVLFMAMYAYVISHRKFKPAKFLAFYVFFTMLFSGGTVPYYILISRVLKLKDTIWVMILPLMVSPFNVLLLRTYFRDIPVSLFEAAKIDGVGEFRIFTRIALPLSLPAIATVSLFQLLAYWNDMYQAMLFVERADLYPIQYLLYKLITSKNVMQSGAAYSGITMPYQSARMALAVIAMLPVFFAFLLAQKYFVRGITLGGLKGD